MHTLMKLMVYRNTVCDAYLRRNFQLQIRVSVDQFSLHLENEQNSISDK